MAEVPPRRVCVFGSGSFGTAMATVAARNGFDVTILARRPDVADAINKRHKNPDYLKEFDLPANLAATTDPVVALAGADFIIHCVPLQASTRFLQGVREHIPARAPIVSTSKGLDVGTLNLMSEIIQDALGAEHPNCYVSGPSFAKELMLAMPTGLMLASRDRDVAEKCRPLFKCNAVRCYLTEDVIGVEVAGALKNVFAIASGCIDGLGLGANTTALLVTRGCREMNRLATAMGSHQHTLSGLAGVGDLMLTCYGKLSRNRSVGYRLGKGETMEDILASVSEVAEGVATTPAAVRLAAKHGVDVPMMQAVDDILAGRLDPASAMRQMMALPVQDE